MSGNIELDPQWDEVSIGRDAPEVENGGLPEMIHILEFEMPSTLEVARREGMIFPDGSPNFVTLAQMSSSLLEYSPLESSLLEPDPPEEWRGPSPTAPPPSMDGANSVTSMRLGSGSEPASDESNANKFPDEKHLIGINKRDSRLPPPEPDPEPSDSTASGSSVLMHTDDERKSRPWRKIKDKDIVNPDDEITPAPPLWDEEPEYDYILQPPDEARPTQGAFNPDPHARNTRTIRQRIASARQTLREVVQEDREWIRGAMVRIGIRSEPDPGENERPPARDPEPAAEGPAPDKPSRGARIKARVTPYLSLRGGSGRRGSGFFLGGESDDDDITPIDLSQDNTPSGGNNRKTILVQEVNGKTTIVQGNNRKTTPVQEVNRKTTLVQEANRKTVLLKEKNAITLDPRRFLAPGRYCHRHASCVLLFTINLQEQKTAIAGPRFLSGHPHQNFVILFLFKDGKGLLTNHPEVGHQNTRTHWLESLSTKTGCKIARKPSLLVLRVLEYMAGTRTRGPPLVAAGTGRSNSVYSGGSLSVGQDGSQDERQPEIQNASENIGLADEHEGLQIHRRVPEHLVEDYLNARAAAAQPRRRRDRLPTLSKATSKKVKEKMMKFATLGRRPREPEAEPTGGVLEEHFTPSPPATPSAPPANPPPPPPNPLPVPVVASIQTGAPVPLVVEVPNAAPESGIRVTEQAYSTNSLTRGRFNMWPFNRKKSN
ncbi:hypothetical protein VE00_02708 [Pseudogymnoascus sp. WSF 3629]|nr:hypothetical protein VE00_02708 [Pseudogymnoascus sp. WSF 3629]